MSPRMAAGARVGVGVMRGGGDFAQFKKEISKLLGFSVYWFLGSKVSWFLGFVVSKFQSLKVSMIPYYHNFHLMFVQDVDPMFKLCLKSN